MNILIHREPTHPGEMLLFEFLHPLNISQKTLANAISIPYQQINQIVNKRRGINVFIALCLAKYFDISVYFWIHLQNKWDIYQAFKHRGKEIEKIQPLALLLKKYPIWQWSTKTNKKLTHYVTQKTKKIYQKDK